MNSDNGQVPPPNRRFKRAAVAAAVAAAILGGGAAGWALHAAAHPTPDAPTRGTDGAHVPPGRPGDSQRPGPMGGAANTPPGGTGDSQLPAPGGAHTSSQAPAAFTPATARQRACDAYAALGVEWASAYDEWLTALPPNWRWSDPAVKDATTRFRTAEVSIAGQLFALVAPNTPPDVASAVSGYGDAILSLAASHERVSSADTNAQLDAVDAAGAAASTACGLPSE